MLDLVPIAKAAQDNKADAISAINVLVGFPSVDIRRGGKPFFLGIETREGIEAQSYSVILGAPLNGVALWHTVRIAQHIDLPLCSGGGIMNWENAVERLMLGATTVQICSTVYLNGLRAVTQCVEGIKSFLDAYGYKDCSQIMGKALDYVVESKDLVVWPLKAVITDPEKCIQCKDICVERVNASCLALSMKDHIAVLDEEECTGCCLCYWFCPEGAVRMEKKG
jgi:dihydropyrimidine dehydrogenase (NAD+) subunit PreA